MHIIGQYFWWSTIASKQMISVHFEPSDFQGGPTCHLAGIQETYFKSKSLKAQQLRRFFQPPPAVLDWIIRELQIDRFSYQSGCRVLSVKRCHKIQPPSRDSPPGQVVPSCTIQCLPCLDSVYTPYFLERLSWCRCWFLVKKYDPKRLCILCMQHIQMYDYMYICIQMHSMAWNVSYIDVVMHCAQLCA